MTNKMPDITGRHEVTVRRRAVYLMRGQGVRTP